MPIFKSDIITARDSLKYSDKAAVDGIKTGALPLIATAVYSLVGTEVTNDIIQLVDLPANVEVIPQLCHLTGADPGTTLTMHIGDAADVDRYAAGINFNAGGQVNFCSGTMPDAVANPYRTPAATRVYATITGAAALTANVKLVFTIAYRIKA